MKSYIDESGTFSWAPEGMSVFAGVSIADRSLESVTHSFEHWKEKIAQLPSEAEVKGSSLNELQLEVFVKWVVEPHRDFHVAVVGADTRNTQAQIVRRWIDEAADVCDAAAALEHSRSNESVGRQYHYLAKWLRQRSPQNGLWIFALPVCILRTIQQAVVRFMEASDDAEFETWDILIDRSLIHTTKHELFWKIWLRNTLYQRTRDNPIAIPNTWMARDHPYVRQASLAADDSNDVHVNVSWLFREHTRFADSRDHQGLQIADVCATIVRRFFSNRWRGPYDRLSRRVLRDLDRHDVLVVHLDETSLRQGRPPEENVKFFDSPSEFPIDG